MNTELLRNIPKVDNILQSSGVKALLDCNPRAVVIKAIREELDIFRKNIINGNISDNNFNEEVLNLENSIIKRFKKDNEYKLKKVVNASGVVIHTNLGRSILNEEVIERIKEVSLNYSNLEYDLDTGKRGLRYSHLEEIISKVTGAEAAMVVNNNAAAVMLVLSSMAKEGEVIVSRGELIEIGGSFRIPDVMEESGAELVAVGTTNKTHLKDYEQAITEQTKAFLKVHTSNYRILGFTESVDSKDLALLKEKYKIPVIEDLGSGVLIDLSKYGLEYEPTVKESIEKGVDLVTFSGDKLLGGVQAGIIVGKKEYIELLKSNPLTRALRVDKFVISALEVIFKYYLDEEFAIKNIPTLRMITEDIESLSLRAEKLLKELTSLNTDKLQFKIVDSYSEVGGGSLPLEKLTSKSIKISSSFSIQKIEKLFRDYEIPVISRIYKDEIYLDIRTIQEDEYEIIKNAVAYILENLKEC